MSSFETESVSGAFRVSNTSRHVGGERIARPPPVAVWVPVGFTHSLAVCTSMDPGSGDPAADCRPPAGSISGGHVDNCEDALK